MEREDAEQVAALGLIKAAEYFRPGEGVPFEAYAWTMVLGELLHHIRDATPLVRVPRRLRSTERRAAAAREDLRERMLREPTTSEVAAMLGIATDDVEEAERARRSQRSEDLAQLRETPAYGLSTPDRVALDVALRSLDERERLLVLATFGAGRTQTELGAHLGCSHVSRLLSRALKMTRHGDSPMADQVSNDFRNKVMHAAFKAGDVAFMASDGAGAKPVDPEAGNISLSLTAADRVEGERVFNALSQGGNVKVPFDDAFWGGKFGTLDDRFGIEWMITAP